MTIFHSKPKKVFTIIAAFAIIILSFYFFAVPKLVNVEKYRPEIEKAVKENISIPVKFGKFSLAMTWNLGIKIYTDHIEVKHYDNKRFISTGLTSIEIYLPALLNKRVEIKEIKTNFPSGEITRLSNGEFDIQALIPKKRKIQKYKIELKHTNINAENFQILYRDKYIQPNTSYFITGKKVEIKNLNPLKHMEILAEGNILPVFAKKLNEKTSFFIHIDTKLPLKSKDFLKNNEISLSGEVNNLYPGIFLPYVNTYLHRNYNYLSGIITAKFGFDINKNFFRPTNFYLDSKINNFIAKKPERGTVIDFYNTSFLSTSGGINNNTLIFDNAQVKSSDINVRFSGKVHNFKANNKTLDLRLVVDNSSVQGIARLFPKEINVPLHPFRKIVKYRVNGIVWTHTIIKGLARQPELFGNVKFNNFSTMYSPKATPKGFGQINFLGKKMYLDIDANTDPSGFVKVKGIVGHINKFIDLDITSTVAELSPAMKTYLIVADIFKIKSQVVSKIGIIQGKGRVNLSIKGGFKYPGLFGYIDIYNGKASYVGLAGHGYNINGSVDFNKNKIIYDNISGYVDGSKVIANGYTTLQGYSDVKLVFPNVDLATGQCFINNSPLLIKTKQTLKSIKTIKGHADTIVYISGTVNVVESHGSLILHNAEVLLEGYAESFKNLKGKIIYTPHNATLLNIKGTAVNSAVIANGTIENGKNVNLILTSSHLDLNAARNFIKNSPELRAAEHSLRDYTRLSGHSQAKLRLSGNINSKDTFKDILLNVNSASFTNKNIGFPIELKNGELFITKDFLFTKGIETLILGTPTKVRGRITGFAANVARPHLIINTDKFDINKIKRLAQIPIVPPKFKKTLDDFKDIKGQLSANIVVYPDSFNVKINFYNTSAVYIPKKLPISINKGSLTITPDSVGFNKLPLQISSSNIFLDGSIKNYKYTPSFDLFIDSKMNSDDVTNYINPYLHFPIESQGIIPVSAIIHGNLDSWNISSKLVLNKGSNISYRGEFGLPEDKTRIILLKASGNKDKIDVNNLEVLMSEDQTTQISALSMKQVLLASGTISKIQTTPSFNMFNILVKNPVSIKILNPAIVRDTNEPFFTQGDFTGNVVLQGNIYSPSIMGNVFFRNVNIPSKDLVINSAEVVFNRDEIIITDSNLNIGDSNLIIKATLSNTFDLPLQIKHIDVSSPSINVDNIVEALKQPTDQKNIFSDIPPFVIESGELHASEMVISNLITNNVEASFNFTPDWLLSINNISFAAAGGTITGQLLYNIESAELSTSLKAQNVEANAAATILLSLPNEVYGTLSGNAEFKSRGRNSRELIANSNGTASFQIDKGRLVRLGSLEYLLRAANVVQSGIGGLNLNNVIDLIAPHKTGYFQNLHGTVTAKNGVLKTEGITSRGKNLSLYLRGSLDMVTNNADIRIFGRVSKKVSGLLGPVGSVSINTFINFIPGVGFLPSSPNEGLIDVIPFLSRIPGLGIGGSRKYRRFVVVVQGDLYNPGSVKSFRWLD